MRRILPVLALAPLLAGCTPAQPGETGAAAWSVEQLDLFFAPVDKGEHMPAGKVYPQGRVFPFMGYSGKNAVDARNGFTVAGPHYGKQADQPKRLADAKAAGLPTIYAVGLDGSFHGENPLQFTEAGLRDAVGAQVRAVARDQAIAWWYLRPEELRMWRGKERDYLRIAAEAIRANDPFGRPVWMYDPNHRDAAALTASGAHLDIVGKGCYVNQAGYRDDRVWVHWSIEQETTACRELEAGDGRMRTPIVMPELCRDPDDPALDAMIPHWVRHDVYRGLMSGAKGVAIWSLFKRSEVRRTHAAYYAAYAQAATELTGPLGLGHVFLFGEDREDLFIVQTGGPTDVELFTGSRKKLEDNTLSEEERLSHTFRYPALSHREITHGGRRYVFLCNSTPETVTCVVTGIPPGAVVTERLLGETVQVTPDGVRCELAAWGVAGLRIRRQGDQAE